MMKTLNVNVNDIVSIAEHAGTIIMDVHASAAPGITIKHDNTPVTKADLAADSYITKELHRLAPFPVLSEENIGPEGLVRCHEPYYWLVDPLDGTKGFIARNQQFSVNIALIHHDRPVLGVVGAPAWNSVYWADESGAFMKKEQGEAKPLRVRSMERDSLVILVSSRSQHPIAEQLAKLYPGLQIQILGSSLKFCVIAEGRADLYVRSGPTSEWDTAAAHYVLEQAGGRVQTFGGDPMRYNKGVADNPSFIALGGQPFDSHELLAAISKAKSLCHGKGKNE